MPLLVHSSFQNMSRVGWGGVWKRDIGVAPRKLLLCAIAETLVKYRPHAVLAGGLRPDAENA